MSILFTVPSVDDTLLTLSLPNPKPFSMYDGVQVGGAETLPAPMGNTVTSGVEIDKGGDNGTEWTKKTYCCGIC